MGCVSQHKLLNSLPGAPPRIVLLPVVGAILGFDLLLMADKLLDRTGSILDALALAAIGGIMSLAAFLFKGGGEDP